MPPPADEDLIQSLRQALQSCAAADETITYRDLAERVGFPGPHVIHRLTALLEVMAREDHAAGRPLLAALAVSRAQDGIPGRGFFHLLGELDRYHGPDQGPEAVQAHRAELEPARRYWGQTGR